MTNKINFAVFPGLIADEDGNEHYIDYMDLIRLYGVRLEECKHGMQSSTESLKGLVRLYPQLDGEYTMMRAIENTREAEEREQT